MNLQLNEIYANFKLIKITDIPEIGNRAYEFIHELSGAKLLYLENEDDNKVFSISFRTTPHDDTGVAHIVEHSTLCGSRKFPSKEPFVELVKGSLNTFLNAMTFPDKTMYPIASRNDKDFRNLMDVYLDAVFFPKMLDTPEILMQEGWHYEIESLEQPLRYSGVVYNEMKGALSSPDSLLERKIMNNLYPDTTYSYESGGDPVAITDLTQEDFVNFHQKYYHPANSYIYLYGKLYIVEQLRFIDEEYLQHFSKIQVDSAILPQQPFTKPKFIEDKYPIAPGEDPQDKTFLSVNYSIGTVLDHTLAVAFTLLVEALMKSEAAPLRNALIKSGIGLDVQSSYEAGILQPIFSIIVNGSNPDKVDEFIAIVDNTLQSIVDNGIDKELLQAAYNHTEFRIREADSGQWPKGLIYNISIMNTWLYDGDPTITIAYEDALVLMQEWIDEGKFEALIEQYLLNNNHRHILVLSPDDTIIPAREEAEWMLLKGVKERMSTSELEEIIASTARLKERQMTKDTPEALETIPLLRLDDIDTEIENLPNKVIYDEDYTIVEHDIDTNGIYYVMLYHNIDSVPEEDIPYIYLLDELITRLDTANYTYEELAKEINLHTGDISFGLAIMKDREDKAPYAVKYRISGKCMKKGLSKFVELIEEIALRTQFTDKNRIRELLLQCKSDFELSILRSGHNLVMEELLSYYSETGYYNNLGNLPFYNFVKNFLDNFDEEFAKMEIVFKRLLPQMFNRNGLYVSITAKSEESPTIVKALQPYINNLYVDKFAPHYLDFKQNYLNIAFATSSPVQYVAQGANFLELGFEYSGTMKVLETIMRYDYLWNNIRVLGGAYGAFVKFQRNGTMLFCSYRDPNLENTLDVYAKTVEYLENFQVNEREMTKYIIGTISNLDTPLTPQSRGKAAMGVFLTGLTDEERKLEREQVLSTTVEDIRNLAKVVRACLQEQAICVLGGTAIIEANKDKFKEVRAL